MMPSKVRGMFPVRPPTNVLRAVISLGRRSFGANMTFAWTDPFTHAGANLHQLLINCFLARPLLLSGRRERLSLAPP